MARTADYSPETGYAFPNLMDYANTIVDICLHDQSTVVFGANHKVGYTTNLPVLLASNQSPYLVVMPGQRSGRHIEGRPIPEDGGAHMSPQVGKIYDWIVDVVYIHNESLESANFTSIETAKGVFEDTFQQYSKLKDSNDVPLPCHMAMEMNHPHTAIFPDKRNYAALRFTVRCYMEQRFKPKGSPF